MSKKISGCICCYLIFVACAFIHKVALGQTTPQPTQTSGTNRIECSADGKIYNFYFNDIQIYRYNTVPDGNYRGNFNGLSASCNGVEYFTPAMCGGVSVSDGERIVHPCESDVSYQLENQSIAKDSVSLLWSMYWNGAKLYNYWMSFRITGKTLVIDIEGDKDNRIGTGITLGEALSNHDDLIVVPVPYLTLTNLLYQKSTKTFTSMFFDWERTNCSRMLPLNSSPGHVLFAQTVDYFQRSDGVRNRVKERIYLTVSYDMNEVMPNIVGPNAPLKSKLQDKIVLSYHPPFPWLLKPIIPSTSLPSYLDTIRNLGITDVALIVKDWWWSGFDGGNPNVLPANDFDMGDWACNDNQRQKNGGDEVLVKVREKAHKYNYMFALHQNYVDMYSKTRPGAKFLVEVDGSLVSRLPGKGDHWAWAYSPNCHGDNAWAIKPSRVFNVAKQVSSEIYSAYNSDWNYLDVTSALNPSGPFPIIGHGLVNSYVDFDASKNNDGRDSAGMFLYTLHKYREIPQSVRDNTNNGPVEGEGGNHFLFIGYFDDFEARIKTAIPNIDGYSAPLLVDFHLKKLRPKSSFHGAGHIYEFYDRGWNTFFTDEEVLGFIATELAYGHGGLVTKSGYNCFEMSPCDHSLKQIVLEYRHVLPMQRLLAKAYPVYIFYFDTTAKAKSASQYIADHPDEFADIHSKGFMGRVRIEYDNGTVVYINRSSDIAGDWVITGLSSSMWYNYNVKLDGVITQGVGAKPSEPLIIPPKCGWVCFSPL